MRLWNISFALQLAQTTSGRPGPFAVRPGPTSKKKPCPYTRRNARVDEEGSSSPASRSQRTDVLQARGQEAMADAGSGLTPIRICGVVILSMMLSLVGTYFSTNSIDAESYSLGEPFNINPNDKLVNTDVLFEYQLLGPECIAVHPKNGMIYTGLKNGQIVEIDLKKMKIEKLIKLTDYALCTGSYDHMEHCGRPLGMRFHKNGDLYYVDAYLGLSRINLEKNHTEKLARYGQEFPEMRPIRYLNDFDFLQDGRIVISESSYKFDDKDYILDILEHRPNGRILIYNPSTSVVTELRGDLYFPNGVQVWNNNIYVAELGQSRILRMNPSTGSYDVFLDRIPGYPDNIRLMNDGSTLLVPLPSRRTEGDDRLFMRPKWREMIAKIFTKGLLDSIVGMLTDSRALVLKVDMNTGEVLESLEDPSGRVTDVTVAVEDLEGNLIFGSDSRPYLARYSQADEKKYTV